MVGIFVFKGVTDFGWNGDKKHDDKFSATTHVLALESKV